MRMWMLALFSAASLFADARVTVEVIHAITRAPLEAVTLDFIFHGDLMRESARAITDAHGKAEVSLSPGMYVLAAERADFGYVQYMPLVNGWVREIVITPDSKSEAITFLLAPPARISGTVRDEWGNPITNLQVQLYQPDWSEGRLHLTLAGNTSTDDRGIYKLHHVPTGNYIFCAQSTSNNTRMVPAFGTYDFSAPPQPRFYARTCIPSSEPDPSRTIHVNSGDVSSFDLILKSTPGIDIQGQMSEQVSGGVELRYRNSPEIFGLSTGSNATGKFSFSGVPAGQYRLSAQADVKVDGVVEHRYASFDLDATGANITDLQLKLDRRATVELAFDEESAGLASKVTNVYLINPMHPNGEMTFLTASKAVEARPGETWLHHSTSGNVCITGATLNEKEIFRQKFSLENGVPYRLTLRVSTHCAPPTEVRAISNGKPAAFSKIAFLLSGTPQSPGFTYIALANPEGKFTFTGVAPGRYLAWAWLDTTILENNPRPYVGPADLASVESQATVLDLAEETSAKVEIPILNQPQQ